MEPVEWIVVGADVLRHPALPANGAIEHPTECDTIDLSCMDAKTNDPARELIHDHQDPVGPQGGRLAPGDEMDEKNNKIAHRRMRSKTGNPEESCAN